MRLLIVGTGYVGLVTGACFAGMGHDVICLDNKSEKVEKLKRGVIPFYEPGLEELVKRNHQAGRLSFTTDYKMGVTSSQILFLALPTPSRDDGSCNLDFLFSAVDEIASHMQEGCVIVNKSTVPVGSSEKVALRIKEQL